MAGVVSEWRNRIAALAKSVNVEPLKMARLTRLILLARKSSLWQTWVRHFRLLCGARRKDQVSHHSFELPVEGPCVYDEVASQMVDPERHIGTWRPSVRP